jgi:hypothetical protein
MLADLRSSKLSKADLSDMKEEAMAEQYGASRETCRKARDKALSEIDLRQIATNDKWRQRLD